MFEVCWVRAVAAEVWPGAFMPGFSGVCSLPPSCEGRSLDYGSGFTVVAKVTVQG